MNELAALPRPHRTSAPALAVALAGALATALAACAGAPSTRPVESGAGTAPVLPAPETSLVPVVNVATATGWPAGAQPAAAPGLRVQAFASGLEHPRWLHVLPNGDVLVVETAAPPRPEEGKGVKGFFMRQAMQKAGSAVPSANRITLLRDADGDGAADVRSVFLQGLNSPFGVALAGGTLYVANTDAIVRFPYRTGETSISAAPVRVTELPGGPLNHHWTKNIIASRDGRKLYATVGSNSNIAENGIDQEVNRAAILEVDAASGSRRLFASGLRNPNGLAWEPHSGVLWTVVNERDELGNDLVPDYLTSVRDGGFYGWPWSYFGAHVDTRVEPARPDMVARAIVPDYALGSHVAPLGLAFCERCTLGAAYAGGAFIGEHGSWNRQPFSGYKVVFVAFQGGRPQGAPRDVLTGFLDDAGNARGRPVGVAIDGRGALLVADDVGNTVWRVSAAR